MAGAISGPMANEPHWPPVDRWASRGYSDTLLSRYHLPLDRHTEDPSGPDASPTSPHKDDETS